jgi:hypothetical protein
MDDAQRARAMAALTLLEGGRQEHAAAMWQAPSLTFVAQAFLLGVLTREGVGWAVAISIAAAGVIATLTAMYALWLLSDREGHFGERVKSLALALGLGNPNRKSRRSAWHVLEWKGWVVWEIVLCVFIVADLLALVCTSR